MNEIFIIFTTSFSFTNFSFNMASLIPQPLANLLNIYKGEYWEDAVASTYYIYKYGNAEGMNKREILAKIIEYYDKKLNPEFFTGYHDIIKRYFKSNPNEFSTKAIAEINNDIIEFWNAHTEMKIRSFEYDFKMYNNEKMKFREDRIRAVFVNSYILKRTTQHFLSEE